MIDVARARAETPGAAERIHFNNCGAALMPRPVLDAVTAHLRREARIGGYEAAEAEAERIERVYDSLASLLGCSRDEIAIVENATRGWDMAFYGLTFSRGDRILTSMAEYASNYIAFLQVARRSGALIEPVPDDPSGQLDVDALERMIDERVKLIAVTHVPTNGGLVNPAAAIGAVARRRGVPFLLDACQSAGQMPLDVEAANVDILSATSRKFLRGPRGAGFLYVRRPWIERLEPPFLDLRSAEWTGRDRYTIRPDARRFETWEGNVAAKIGLGAAVDYALGWGMEAIRVRVTRLADRLRDGLSELPGVTVHDRGATRCGIVTFSSRTSSADGIAAGLAARRVNVTVTRRSSTLLDMDRRGIEAMVRAGVHYYNTEGEVDRVVMMVGRIVRGL